MNFLITIGKMNKNYLCLKSIHIKPNLGMNKNIFLQFKYIQNIGT